MKKNLLITILLNLIIFDSWSEDISLCKDGWSSYRNSEYKAALKLYEECIKKGNLTKSSLAQTYRNIGLLYNKTGKYKKAIKYFDKSLNNRLEDFESDYANKANSYDMLKQAKKALYFYNLALNEFPLCRDVSRNDIKVILYSPRCGEIYYNRGVFYERQGDNMKAIQDFKYSYLVGNRSKLLLERFIYNGIDPNNL